MPQCQMLSESHPDEMLSIAVRKLQSTLNTHCGETKVIGKLVCCLEVLLIGAMRHETSGLGGHELWAFAETSVVG